MSTDLPPPVPTPPGLERAVQEHLDVIHAVGELRRDQASTAATLARLVEAQTVDRLTLGRIEKQLAAVLARLGVQHG